MIRSNPVHFVLALSGLALACDSNPTQPEADLATAPLVSGSWTARAALSTGATGVALGVVPGAAGQSIVYSFGGTREGFTGFVIAAYDVAANTWSGRTARVFVERSNGVGRIGSRFYFSGGYDWSSGSRAASQRLYAYDYRNDRLIRRADIPKATAEGVTGVIHGKLYVLPGLCSGDGGASAGWCETEPIRQLYRYDPATNTWATRRQAPHYHRSGGGAVLDNKFYVVGGFNAFTPVAHLDVYDPATNTWTIRAPIPTPGAARATAFQGKLFVVSSAVENDRLVHRAYEYNPSTNTWRSRPAPPAAGAIAKVLLDGRARVLAVNGTGDEFKEPVPSWLYTP